VTRSTSVGVGSRPSALDVGGRGLATQRARARLDRRAQVAADDDEHRPAEGGSVHRRRGFLNAVAQTLA